MLAAYLGEAADPAAAGAADPRPTGPERLRVVGLTAGYGGAPVLKGVDLEVRGGEVVALLGANGAGKSTLMRSLIGLRAPLAGEILQDRTVCAGVAPETMVRRGAALVPEGRQVFPELSVLDNLRLGAFVDPRALGERIEAALDRFPALRPLLQRPAGLLSGGEQQMLAIGRALMSRPTLLLLDEPSLGLAPRVARQLFEQLRSLNAQTGTAMLVVDQMAGLALELAARAYLLRDGEIVAAGSSAEMAASPALRQAYLAGGPGVPGASGEP